MRGLEQFDYIIVGAGSAGAVLAARLSQLLTHRVLLLEAGPVHHDWRIDMPTALARAIRGPRFNWQFRSEPEPHLHGRVIDHPRGRVLGGSSSINGMMYIRGHPHDYDRWARAGCTGWSYADVLPYFKRAEAHDEGADSYHGGDGPLAVATARGTNPLFDAFIRAGVEAGYPHTEDVNGRQQEGFGRIDRTVDPDGRRSGVARAYLDPVRSRRNLVVITGAVATRVLLDGRRAVGVEYRSAGRQLRAYAAAEVILTGGAINSPQLLMLSGIGPAAQLREHGIGVVHDLPGVGANLQDHPDFAVVQACRQPVSLHGVMNPLGKLRIGLRWLLLRDGLGATNHYEAGAFIRSRAGIEHPDLQLTFVPIGLGGDEAQAEVSIGQHAFSTHCDLLRPTSRGTLRLRSNEPLAHPLLAFNYLASTEDREALVSGVRLVREIHAQSALETYRGDELRPGPGRVRDDELAAWLRTAIGTSYHPVGTCRMGPSDDTMAVVDPALKVKGVTGLRVADAAVMPDLVSGNTNAPTIMIGEKAADLILDRGPPPPLEAEVWCHPSWATAQR